MLTPFHVCVHLFFSQFFPPFQSFAVDAILQGRPESDEIDAPATISSEMESLDFSLSKLIENIDTIMAYTEKVNSGEIVGDNEIGRIISEVLASVPLLDPTSFEKMFTSHVQDMLMVHYLAEVTRTQIALSDKLNGVAQQ